MARNIACASHVSVYGEPSPSFDTADFRYKKSIIMKFYCILVRQCSEMHVAYVRILL